MAILINQSNLSSFDWEAKTFEGENYYVLKVEKGTSVRIRAFDQSLFVEAVKSDKYLTRKIGPNKLGVTDNLTGWSAGHVKDGQKVAEVVEEQEGKQTGSENSSEDEGTDKA